MQRHPSNSASVSHFITESASKSLRQPARLLDSPEQTTQHTVPVSLSTMLSYSFLSQIIYTYIIYIYILHIFIY